MNALEKIKEGVSGGVKAVERKLALIENNIAEVKSQNELQRAEEMARREQERLRRDKERAKVARKKEWVKSWKRWSLTVRRVIALALSGLSIYALGGFGTPLLETSVTPMWALGLMAVSVVWMITGRLIPIKAGCAALGALVLVRDNGWLWGALDSVALWKLIAASAVVAVVVCVTCLVMNIKNGARNSWGKAVMALRTRTGNIRKRFEEIKKN